MSEEPRQKRTPAEQAAVRFFVKLGKPKVDKAVFASAASKLGGLLEADGSNLEAVLATINFALEGIGDDTFWVPLVSGAKDPVGYFCEKYETISQQVKVATLKAKAEAAKRKPKLREGLPSYRYESGKTNVSQHRCAACNNLVDCTQYEALFFCNDRCYPIVSKFDLKTNYDGYSQAMADLMGKPHGGKQPRKVKGESA